MICRVHVCLTFGLSSYIYFYISNIYNNNNSYFNFRSGCIETIPATQDAQ